MALQKRLTEYKDVNRYLLHCKTYSCIKKIGSPSKNANIYLCSYKDIKFARKEYKISSLKDIRLTLKLSSLVLSNINPHFLITYKYSNGTLLNELAQGDLKSFLKTYIRYDVLVNSLQQILVCVLSFHAHCSMHHTDCHAGNFLYKRIPKGGCIHYKIHGKDIYIENLGYLWMINDYDLATEDTSTNYSDYSDAIQAFHKYKKNKKFNILIEEISNVLLAHDTTDDLFHHLIDNIHLFKMKINGYVINNIPFIL